MPPACFLDQLPETAEKLDGVVLLLHAQFMLSRVVEKHDKVDQDLMDQKLDLVGLKADISHPP